MRLNFLRALSLLRALAFHILEGCEFLPNFREVALLGREFKSGQDGGEMRFFLHGLFKFRADRELGAF